MGQVLVVFPPHGAATTASRITVCGRVTEPASIAHIAVNGIEARSGDGFATWDAEIPLAPGATDLAVVCTDREGNTVEETGPQVVRMASRITVPKDLELAPDGRVLVLDGATKEIVSIDPDTFDEKVITGPSVGSGPLMSDPAFFALAPDGLTAALFDHSICTVLSIDLATGARRLVSSAVFAGGVDIYGVPPEGDIVCDGTRALLFGLERDFVVVNMTNGQRASLSGSAYPDMRTVSGIALDGNRILVAENSADKLLEIDAYTGAVRVVSADPGDPLTRLGRYRGLALLPGQDAALAFSVHPDTHEIDLVRIDLRDGGRTRLDLEDGILDRPSALFVRSGRAIVAEETRGLVHAFDLATGAASPVVAGVAVGRSRLGEGVAWDPAGRLIVLDPTAGELVGIDPATGERRIVTTLSPHAMARGEAFVNADDDFVLYVNGIEVRRNSDGTTTHPARLIDFSAQLRPGRNVLAFQAINTAGLGWAFFDGRAGTGSLDAPDVLRILSGRDWRCASSVASEWATPAFDASGWIAAVPYSGAWPPDHTMLGTSAALMWHPQSFVNPAYFRYAFDLAIPSEQVGLSPDGTAILVAGDGGDLVIVDTRSGDARPAGVRVEGSAPFALDGTNGRVFAVDGNTVVAVDLGTGVRTPIATGIEAGRALTVDAAGGNVYTTTTLGVILDIDVVTGEVRSVTAPAAPPFSQPVGIVLDERHESLLVLDAQAKALYAIDPVSGFRATVSGDTRGTGPAFESPTGLAFDPEGGIAYVTDAGRLLAIDVETGERVVLAH